MSHISKLRFGFFISVFGPMLFMTLSFVAYLTYTLSVDKLDHEKSYNSTLKSVLVEDARYALTLGGYEQLQNKSDNIVASNADHIHSIELIDSKNRIVISSPKEPDVSISAIRIPIYVHVPNEGDDIFNMDTIIDPIENKSVGGYLIIRNNASYIQKSTDEIIYMVIVILLITGLGGGVVLYRIRKQYFTPHQILMKSLGDMAADKFISNDVKLLDPEVSDVINTLNTQLKDTRRENQDLKNEVKATLSSVDAANIDRIEILSELVRGIDKGLEIAREKIVTIASLNSNTDLKQDIKYLMSYLESTQEAVINTKVLLDQPIIDSDVNIIIIADFCESLVNTVTSHNSNVLCGKILNPELCDAYISLDEKHFETLICSVIDVATHVSKNSEIQLYVSAKTCLKSKDYVTVMVNIDDTCQGMPRDEVIKLNEYLNNKTSSISSNYFVIEDLKKIKYLSGLPNLSFTFNPVYGRGNNYSVIIDCRFSNNSDDLVIEHGSKSRSVAIVDGNASVRDNIELFRQLNLNVTYYKSKDAFKDIDSLINNDVIIVDSTKKQQSMLELCKALIDLEYYGRIIPAVSDELLDDSVVDELNCMGINKTIPARFLPNTLKEYVLNTDVKQFSISDYLSAQKDK